MRTPMEWFFNQQKTVETAPSAFVVAQTATWQILDVHYTLCILGVTLDGPAWMFGDNEV
jgi:hypothetical protein